MNHVGFSELALLFVIGLVILGPERLPRVASQLGRWVGRARRTAHQLRQQLEREVALHDIGDQNKWKPPPRPGSSTPPDESSAPAQDDPGQAVPDSEQSTASQSSAEQSSAANTTAAENGATERPTVESSTVESSAAESDSREEPPSR